MLSSDKLDEIRARWVSCKTSDPTLNSAIADLTLLYHEVRRLRDLALVGPPAPPPGADVVYTDEPVSAAPLW